MTVSPMVRSSMKNLHAALDVDHIWSMWNVLSGLTWKNEELSGKLHGPLAPASCSIYLMAREREGREHPQL